MVEFYSLIALHYQMDDDGNIINQDLPIRMLTHISDEERQKLTVLPTTADYHLKNIEKMATYFKEDPKWKK